MNTNTTVEFTPEKRDRLREAWSLAVKEGKDDFVFDGHTYLVSYARYLLEYLDSVLPKYLDSVLLPKKKED